MKPKKILGISFILLGVIISVSNLSITGAVIGSSLSNYFSFIALIFFIGGIGLLMADIRITGNQRIEEVINQYQVGSIDVIHAVSEINKIDPIQAVRYRTGKQHSIVGNLNAYTTGLKSGKAAEELAMTAYLLAGKNNPIGARNSNIEIAKGISTKHYMEGFKKVLGKFKENNKKDLLDILGIPA
jgi:hypothetical protein